MLYVQARRYLLSGGGGVLFALGLLVDSFVGMNLLNGASLLLLLLHVLAVVIWGAGTTFLTCGAFSIASLKLTRLDRWTITASCLGLLTFPGIGLCAFSIALGFACFIGKFPLRARSRSALLAQPAPRSSEVDTQSLIDRLYSADLEGRRAALAALGRQGDPASMHLVRQLLVDPQPEIRSDASLLLTRFDEELSRELNAAFERWEAQPEQRELMLDLAEHYSRYAASNVLDNVSQRFYYAKARDLLLQVACMDAHAEARADTYLKLARVRRSLGEHEAALQDAYLAIELCPDLSDAYALAVELAYTLHAWSTLVALIKKWHVVLPDANALHPALQWWATLPPELAGGATHG